MKTLFIADLHLSEERSDISELFFNFLQTSAREAQALYILGDLFEVWIGDDNINAFTGRVAEELNQLRQSGVPIYFIHGNRDFLLGEKYAKKAGMTLLPEQQLIDLYGQRALIMHGDSLCTLDIDYQKFRTKSRKKWWQIMMLSLPLFIRRAIANKARARSTQLNSNKSMTIMDVTQSQVEQQMRDSDVNLLIHGHTHRPDTHRFKLDNQDATRIVLGDWYTQGSILVVTPQHISLEAQPFLHC